MLTPLGIVSIIIGVFVCFMGYSLFRSMLPLWGFIIGGFFGIIMLPTFLHVSVGPDWVEQVGSFVIVGAIGALIAKPMYYVIIFLSGAAMGGLVGIILGAYLTTSAGTVSVQALNSLASMSFPPRITSPLQVVLMVVFGMVMGGLAIGFQKFMIIASTAFLGSAAIVSGLSGSGMNLIQLNNPNSGFLAMGGWLLLGMLGVFIQFRMMDET